MVSIADYVLQVRQYVREDEHLKQGLVHPIGELIFSQTFRLLTAATFAFAWQLAIHSPSLLYNPLLQVRQCLLEYPKHV